MNQDHVESAVARTGHDRLRWLASDDNPDEAQRKGYRRIVSRMSDPDAALEYPPLIEQASNILQSALTFVKSGCKIVDQAEFDRRHSICEGCDQFDAVKDRCKACGCALNVKPWGRAMDCPLDRWKVGG